MAPILIGLQEIAASFEQLQAEMLILRAVLLGPWQVENDQQDSFYCQAHHRLADEDDLLLPDVNLHAHQSDNVCHAADLLRWTKHLLDACFTCERPPSLACSWLLFP